MQFSMNQFTFKGLQNYDSVQEKIFRNLEAAFTYTDYDFQQAVDEAVCNAAKYSIAGPTKARITINVRRMPFDIAVTVYAETHPFDAQAYRDKLYALLKDKETAEMDWGDYVGLQPISSGFWYMLTGCNYLYIDEDGQSITLVAKTSGVCPDQPKTTKIKYLVPRFFVRRKISGGVIT